MIPGAVFVGFGFLCMASIIHRIPMGFMHIGGSPILFSFPGVQTHSFVPFDQNGHGAVGSNLGYRRIFCHMFGSGEARSGNSWVFRLINHVLAS
jgi:hypothetical protein